MRRGCSGGFPRIGGTKDPDVARILALKPDLVFANQEENRIEDVRALETAGVEVDVTFPRTVSEVPASIRQWGSRMGEGSEDEAEALARRIEGELKAVEAEASGAPFLRLDLEGPVDDGGDSDTYVADLLGPGEASACSAAGGRYPTTITGVLERGADVHFFPSEPFPFDRRSTRR